MAGIAPGGERGMALEGGPGGVPWRSAVIATSGAVKTLAVWSLPAFLLFTACVRVFTPSWAWDFRAFYHAAGLYAHHVSPYPKPLLSALAGQEGFVYPLPIAALFAPFWALPWALAAPLFILLCAAAVVGTLKVLGVRDWRCYAVALLVWPTQWGIVLGTLSPILAFLLALLWRYRDRRVVAASLLAALVVSKLFLWPLALWFLAMRRYRTVAYAAAGGAAAVVLATLPFGLGTLNDYRVVLRVLSGYESTFFGLSPLSFFKSLGIGGTPALAAVAALAVPLLVGLVRAARTRDELLALRVTIALAFVCSPIVWGHYFVLFLVPLALMRPRLSWVWFALAVVPGDLAWWGADENTLRAVWIAAVWIFALAQLGFLPKIPRLSVRVPAPILGLAGTMLLLVVLGLMARYEPYTIALEPATAARPDGAAFVQVSRKGTSVCGTVWTEGLTGRVAAVVRGPAGARYPVPMSTRRDGTSGGCGPLPSRAVSKAIRHHPERYRLELRPLSGGPSLSGALLSREDAGRPPGWTSIADH